MRPTAATIRKKSGSDTRAIHVISFFVIPCSTNRLNPPAG
jgi:hypothetical protein